MSPAYKLSVAPELRRALDAFPVTVRQELQSRIENTLALPVAASPFDQTTTIEVEGHKATLRLDTQAMTVHLVDLYSPKLGWTKPKSA